MSLDTSKVATSNGATAATASKPSKVGGVASWADERLGLATAARKNLRKVFPDHWSFMLGEIALWSFVVLLLTGVFLTLWFTPSMGETTYEGSYNQLRGVELVGHGRIIDDEAQILEIGKAVAVKYNGPNAVSDAALPFIEAQARKRLGVAFEIERTVSWDHTKLGGAY